MKWLVIAILLFVPITAAAQDSKELSEVDALRLERLDMEFRALAAEIAARQERIERLKLEAANLVKDVQQRLGADGWQLDLAKRRFVSPPKEK